MTSEELHWQGFFRASYTSGLRPGDTRYLTVHDEWITQPIRLWTQREKNSPFSLFGGEGGRRSDEGAEAAMNVTVPNTSKSPQPCQRVLVQAGSLHYAEKATGPKLIRLS